MSPVHVEVSKRVRDRSVVKGGKNAAGEVIIGGRRLKICPKTVRERKLAVPNTQEIGSSRGRGCQAQLRYEAGRQISRFRE